MMMEALWHAVLLSANLWGPGGLDGLNHTSTGAGASARSDRRTPVLPPIKAGEKIDCCEAPTEAEILRALPRLARIEGFYEECRDDIQMTFEKLLDQVDRPRFFPLIGPAQLHHVHWKCTVSFMETIKICYPVLEVKRKRSEVVYIDKDHLHLCVAEKDDAEAQEIRPMPKGRAAKCTAVPVVQLDIVVATVNRSARPKLTYPWADSANDLVGIIADPKAAHAFLYKLRKDGVLDFVASPKLMTLSGQPAEYASGQQVEFKTADGAISQHIGSRIKAMAQVKADGKIVLEVRADVTTLNPARLDESSSVPGFDKRSCQATFEMRDGQTLALRQVTQEEREVEKRITLIDNNPFIGAWWATIKKREGINEDTVILVTPHIVEPCPCEAEEQEQPDTRVVACWENRADPAKLTGSVYLFSEETKRTVEAAGRIEVQAFDMAPALKGEEPRLLAQWTFHPDMLEKLRRKDQIGVGYTLSVNWTDIWPDLSTGVENLKLQTVYVPAAGASCSDAPTYLARQGLDNSVLSPGRGEVANTKVVQAQSVSRTERGRLMTFADVIKLCKAEVDRDVIVRQIEVTGSAANLRLTVENVVQLSNAGAKARLIQDIIRVTNSVFDLRVDDLLYLSEQEVYPGVITTMQDTMR